MRTKTGLYKQQELTYQTWQTNSRYKYQPPLPLGRCEFDSWCSLAPAVGMRKHGMGAEGRQSENCFAGLILCREGGGLPVHSTKPVDGGAGRRLVVAPGGRLSPQSPSDRHLLCVGRRVNPTRARPPQTTRRAHRVAVQLQGAHRRPYWELQEVRFLVHLMEILCKLGSQPGNLLLHDGHTRPDLVDPPGLAGDMAGGGPEAVLQQEIPVI